jgi:hypothetical protein
VTTVTTGRRNPVDVSLKFRYGAINLSACHRG